VSPRKRLEQKIALSRRKGRKGHFPLYFSLMSYYVNLLKEFHSVVCCSDVGSTYFADIFAASAFIAAFTDCAVPR